MLDDSEPSPGHADALLADSELSPSQADALLADVRGWRTKIRRASAAPTFPLIYFGAVTMLSAAAIALVGTPGIICVWALAGGAGLWLTARHYRLEAKRSGVTFYGRRTGGWAVALFVVCFLAGVLGDRISGRDGGIAATILVVLAAYLAIGWQQRRADGPLAVAAAATGPLIMAAGGVTPWLVELVFGAALIGSGLVLRSFRDGP